MRSHACSKIMCSSVLGTALAAVPQLACASGFALLEQSSAGLGTSFAGIAALADDPSTIFFNAAGLTHLDKPTLTTSVTGININTKFHDSGSQPAFGQPLGANGGDAGGLTPLPAIYGSIPVTKNIVAGLAVNVPFGLRTKYDDDFMGRFQALKSEVQTFNFNPAIAIRLNDFVSIGLGADLQHIQAELTSDVNYSAAIAQTLPLLVQAGQVPAGAVPTLIAANAGLQGRTKVRGDDTSWGFDLGVLLDLSPNTRLGLAYRSAIDYTVAGTVTFNAPTPTNLVGAGIIAAASAPGAALANGPVTLDLKLPASARASLVQKVTPSFDLLADVSWTQWSTVQQLLVRRTTGVPLSNTIEKWRDTWRYAVGASYALNSAWKLRAGVAYDQTPVPDATRTPRLPDESRTWISVGAQWRVNDVAAVDAGYAHLLLADADLNQNAGNQAAYGLLDGTQKTSIDILGVQLSVKF